VLKIISIKLKIYFFILVPVIGVLYFYYIDIQNKNKVRIEANKVKKINLINDKLAYFINELQLERALRGSLLKSNDNYFKNKLLIQEKSTDKQFKLLQKFLSEMSYLSSKELLNLIQDFYRELAIIRNSKQLSEIPYSEVISFYSMNINLFLDFIYKSAEQTNNTELSKMILSYSYLLFAKEKNGIKRVLVTSLLIDKKISFKDKLNLNNLILLQKINLSYFVKNLENQKLLKEYKNMVKENSFLKVKVIEKQFLKNFTLPVLTPKGWFELISQNIKKEHVFSKKLSSEILLKSKQFRNVSFDEMQILIYLVGIILVCFLFLMTYIYNEINKELTQIMSGISFLSKNNIIKYEKIIVNSSSELAQIALKFNEMVDELQQREKNNQEITLDLKKSKEKLEQNNKIKSQFLANMSHEIRTPLNAIVGFINIIKDDEKDQKKIEYFNIINASSQNLLEMINDILDFSKIENDEIVLDPIEIKLVEELHSIIDLFKFKIKEKELSFTVNIDSNLPKFILIDCLKLKQVLTNLLGNAVKFTENKRSITFTVKYDNCMLFFSIEDEGIGVPFEKQKMIFEPFLQADNSTTRKYGGTGLGLAISKKFVHSFGGELKIKSEEDMGSEFYFNIPVHVIDKPIETKLDNIDEDSKLVSSYVLLVEDNKANQMFMTVILNKLNLKYDIANDGIEAVDMFKKKKYDIVLMDENMPNLSGIEATKKILKYEKIRKLKHTPVIALTANALVGDRQRFLESGMDEYLSKPISKKDLSLMLKKFLVLHEKKS